MSNTDQWDPNYKHPGALKARLTLFWGSNYKVDKSKEIVEYAEKLLAQHGIGMDVYPGKTRTDKHTIKIPDLVETTEYNDYRLKMGAIYDDQKTGDKRQRIPVFFCQYRERGNGFTVLTKGPGDPENASPWLPYIFISMNADPDYSNLIHEIGHAANQNRQHSTTEGNIMHDAPAKKTRDTIVKAQVQVIAKAYFVK
jgi:hypothetical protein